MSVLGDIADVGNFAMDIWRTGYQMDMQQKTWDREDSAIARRVEDLRKSGLSPVLAAGSAAQTSAPVNVSAPQYSRANAMQSVSMQTAQAQKALTDQQRDLVGYQTARAEAEAFVPAMTINELRKDASREGRKSYDLIMSGINKSIAENRAAERNAEEVVRNTNLAREYGVASNSIDAMDAITMSRLLENSTGGLVNGPLLSGLTSLLKLIAGGK